MRKRKVISYLKIRASRYASTLNHICTLQVPSWTIRMGSTAKALSSTTPMHHAPAPAEKVLPYSRQPLFQHKQVVYSEQPAACKPLGVFGSDVFAVFPGPPFNVFQEIGF